MFTSPKSDSRLLVSFVCHPQQKNITSKKFYLWAQIYTLTINVPMCALHFKSASFTGTAEKLVGKLGVLIGILAGVFAALMLLLRWQGTGEGNILLNLFAGGVFGLGIFLTVWVIISLLIQLKHGTPSF
jgi:hypothetical protein